jgi:sirohydrochlorin cobaltochelatase
MDKKGFILLAHGSRRPDWKIPFENLANELDTEEQGVSIKTAYLELTPPSFPEALQQMVEAGIQEISILPLFMAAGSHTKEDIPRLVADFQEQHPDIKTQILPIISSHPTFKAMLREIVGQMI